MIVCVPAPAVGVYVTEHVEVVVLDPCCASVHGLPEKPPVPLVVKLTVPCGNDVVPDPVSTTVAVHVEA